MTPDSSDYWSKVQILFERALELPPAERAARIAEWCAGDPNLLREVQSMVDASAAEALAHDAGPSSPQDQWIGRTLGAYRVLRLIGRGGMGAVYFGERAAADFRQDAAIKVIAARLASPWLREQFLVERQTLAKLSHPNIARLLDGGVTTEGEPYLVMEFIEGQPLDQYCAALPPEAIARLFLDLCAAVSFVHRNLIVHRDLKPGNVLVTPEGAVKLLDFGAAKLMAPTALDGGATSMGMRALTPNYASPEQIAGDAVTMASDVYSLGVILYRLLAGRVPFDFTTATAAQSIQTLLQSPPQPPSQVSSLRGHIPADLDAIVLQALRPEPRERYASADDLAADIRNFLARRPVSARRPSITYRADKFIRRRGKAIVAAAVAAAALTVAAAATLHEGRVAAREEARSSKGFDEVRRLADLVLFDFYGQVRQLEGSTDVQRQLVSQGLTYLDGLSRDAGGDMGVQLSLVDAYTKMGNVLGNPYEENLGDAAKAIATLERAVRLGEDAVRSLPGDAMATRRLALARRSLGEVHFSAGNAAIALPFSRAAAASLEALAMRPGATVADIQEAASTVDGLGDMYGMRGAGSTGDTAAALENYRRALALQQRALGLQPDSVRSQRGVAVGRMKIANMQSDAAPVLAVQGYQDALATLDRLPLEARGSASITRLHSFIQQKLADVYLAIGRAADARPVLEAARDYTRDLAARDPDDSRTRFDLLGVDTTLSDIDEELGDLPAAREADQESLRVANGLLKRTPSNKIWQGRRAEALFRLGALDIQLKEPARGEQETREAIAVAAHAADSHEATADDAHRLAHFLIEAEPAGLRDPQKAVVYARRSVELSHGANASYLVSLSQAQKAAGDEPGARETATKALALLPAPEPGQPDTALRKIAVAAAK